MGTATGSDFTGCGRLVACNSDFASSYSRLIELQLPHNGRAGEPVRRGNGGVGLPVVAAQAVSVQMDAVDRDVELPLPIHREHRRMDYSRGGPAAVVGLRVDANRAGLLANRVRWKRVIRGAWLHGNVHRIGHSLSVPPHSR